jgi:AspT/YidE/YbjL antiporter-like protein
MRNQTARRGNAVMNTVRWIISTAPEIFLLLAVAIGTVLGRIRIRGFSLGTTACTLIVAVLIGQLGALTFPSVLRIVLFSLFVFTIGYRSGPEFFASLSVRTLAQVALALVLGGTGLIIVLSFAFIFSLDPGTASGLAAGALTQSSVIGTASGALAQLGLPKNVLDQQEANIAAGYAVTYVLGYILTLLFVPFVAPKLMQIDLKKEAAKLEVELSGGTPPKTENLAYRKFQARAYRVSVGAGRTVKAIEDEVGSQLSSSELSTTARISSRIWTRFSRTAMTLSSPVRPPPLSPPNPSSVPRLMLTKSCERSPATWLRYWSTIANCTAGRSRRSSNASATTHVAYSCVHSHGWAVKFR